MELLAPAGNWDALAAAIANGADAVYLGGKQFSARQSADNFDEKQIKEAISYAHIRGRRIYVAINTLLDNEELPPALDYVFELCCQGADAVIVQDLGLMQGIRSILPDMRVHASTQMTIHNAPGVQFLAEQGVKRIVMAREMSLNELSSIKQELPDVELEYFVHGAICYSYSGQCLFSSIVGGRSGNRGRCAQPCRLPYELYARSSNRPAAGKDSGKYLLSPSDLKLIDYLPRLQQAGIDSLKIEGRMKRPEYVAVVTRAYREAIDLLESESEYAVPEKIHEQLAAIFNRNFTMGYLGVGDDDFLSIKRPNNRGVAAGRVVGQTNDLYVHIKLTGKINLGDGIEVWTSRGKNPALIIKEMWKDGQKVSAAGSGDIVAVRLEQKVGQGDRVFKTHDAGLITEALNSIHSGGLLEIPVDAEAYLEEGKPLRLVFKDDNGNQVEDSGESKAVKAEKQPLDKHKLEEKVGRLGNTPFCLRNFELYSAGDLIVPYSEVNDLRRRLTDELGKKYLKEIYPSIDYNAYAKSKQQYLQAIYRPGKKKKPVIPELAVVVRGPDEAVGAIDAGAQVVYVMLEGLSTHKRVNELTWKRLMEHAAAEGSKVVPAMPRIQKPDDINAFDWIWHSSCDEVMVGNPGSLKLALQFGKRITADYSLNVFNKYSLAYLFNTGVDTVCLSPELTFAQIKTFSSLEGVEILIHGELILMVSEHCNLPDILGKNDKGKCPGHCRNEGYYLQDQKGYKFPVETDAFCRFYLFNSRTLCLMEDLDKVVKLSPTRIRIEARRCERKDVGAIVEIYRQVLAQMDAGIKPDLGKYKEQLAKYSYSDFTKLHYYRGVL